MANALIFEQILSTSSMRKCMAISLENLYVIIGLKVYVCPNVDVFNYISVQGKVSYHVVIYRVLTALSQGP